MLIGKKISDLSEFEELGGEAQRSVERAIAKNIAVGVLVGYYDEKWLFIRMCGIENWLKTA